jgi:membrane-associated HD superfamily phosphohydrolase
MPLHLSVRGSGQQSLMETKLEASGRLQKLYPQKPPQSIAHQPTSDKHVQGVKASAKPHQKVDPAVQQQIDKFVDALCTESQAMRTTGANTEDTFKPGFESSTATSTAQQFKVYRVTSQAYASTSESLLPKSKDPKISPVKEKIRGGISSSKPAWTLSEQQAEEVQLEEEL